MLSDDMILDTPTPLKSSRAVLFPNRERERSSIVSPFPSSARSLYNFLILILRD
jgi:hypothetical protein